MTAVAAMDRNPVKPLKRYYAKRLDSWGHFGYSKWDILTIIQI